MRQTTRAKKTSCNQRFAGLTPFAPAILKRSQKQRKTPTSRPLPKRKIFPFLELPAEIRNMIYTYALTDPSGINFVAVQRHKRRCVERVSRKTLDSHSRTYYRSNRINYNLNDANDLPTSLAPSLLAVSKQIHQEGCNILYSNELVFADTVALYAFMINLGPAGASHLKIMRLKGWGYGRTTKAYNNACFAVLIWATNLEKFHLDAYPGWYRQPKGAAQQFYRDAFPWLEAVGHTKGKFDAALDVLGVIGDDLERVSYYGSYRVSGADARKEFKTELSRNLGLQQKRVMAKSVKRRKVSKVSDES